MRIALLTVLTAISGLVMAEWKTTVDIDEMTGEKSAYALSAWAGPTRPVRGVYSDVRGIIGYGCSEGDEWVYLKFNQIINSPEAGTRDGYNMINGRVRWGQEEPGWYRARQDWGKTSMQLLKAPVDQLMRHDTVLYEVNWYSAGEVMFKFDLAGSSKAIAEAREACR